MAKTSKGNILLLVGSDFEFLSSVPRFKVCLPFLFLETVLLLGKGGNTGQVGWLSGLMVT